ncbi:MAG: hypothetical protein U0946_00710 [Patescibacteria group bacterium]|nr:hypothetical protein [Patescibacteria group bacterium]
METYSKTAIIKKIQDSPLLLVTLNSLHQLTGIQSALTLKRLAQDLVTGNILNRLERNKYIINDGRMFDFTIANLLYSPSYVSFETALNHYGILSQFPYETTSATPKKSKQKIINQKAYSFTHLKKTLFWGYVKQDNYLIAEPEKALLDQLYLYSKGLKSISLDEYDYARLDQTKLFRLADYFPQSSSWITLISKLKKFLSK